VLVEGLVAGILADIEAIRKAPVPLPSPGAPVEPPRPAPPARSPGEPAVPPGVCLPPDERAIRRLGDTFAIHWRNQDARALSELWVFDGDVFHPDGYTERGPNVIRQNRAQLFAQKAYADSRHPLTLSNIRCIRPEIAIADGKWELRGVTDGRGQPVPSRQGLVTIVASKGRSWMIEAYRYTIDQPGPASPTLLSRPGGPTVIR
jgi:uncharacterized protein (TIGR02246 family)